MTDVPKPPHPDEDICSKVMGHFGPWQIRVVIICCLIKGPSSWFFASTIYTAPTPKTDEIYCQQEDGGWTKIPNPSKDKGDKQQNIAFCQAAEGGKSSGMSFRDTSCKAYSVVDKNDDSGNADSLVLQYGMMCSRAVLVSIGSLCHIAGTILGEGSFFVFVKWISPRHMLLTSLLGNIFCCLMTGMASNFEMHVIFRACQSYNLALCLKASKFIMLDVTGGIYRYRLRLFYEMTCSIGLFVLPGVASFWNSWKELYILMALPYILVGIFYSVIPDSPRWLIKNEEYSEAYEILMYAAEVNGNEDIPDNVEDQMVDLGNRLRAAQPKPWIEIFQVTGGWLSVAPIHACWGVFSMSYTNIIMTIRGFGTDYLSYNCMIMAVAEMIGLLCSIPLIQMPGKKKWLITAILSVFVAILSTGTWLVPADSDNLLKAVYYMILMTPAKVLISIVMNLMHLCTYETAPVGCEAQLEMSCHMFGKISGLLGPGISLLGSFGVPAGCTSWGMTQCVGGLSLFWVYYSRVYRIEIPRLTQRGNSVRTT